MTSAHSMHSLRPRRLRLRAVMIVPLALCVAVLCGCTTRERLRQPSLLVSPYDHAQLWAVAPFANESGVSIVQTDRVADAFAEQIEQIEGIAMVPVNRVIAAMSRLQMRSIASPADAHSLMNVLGVDGLIIGTVTAYDPYSPLKLGAAVQLWRREATMARSMDPVALTRAATELASPGALPANQPAAQASGMFDASNHQTIKWLDEYSIGRAEPNSAYGKRIYLVNMEMYTQFVAYRLLHDLLAFERDRLQPEAAQPER